MEMQIHFAEIIIITTTNTIIITITITMATLVKIRMSAAAMARSGGRREAFCQCTEPPTFKLLRYI